MEMWIKRRLHLSMDREGGGRERQERRRARLGNQQSSHGNIRQISRKVTRVPDGAQRPFSPRRLFTTFSGSAVPGSCAGRRGVKDEFRRITAANLERTSLTKLDFYAPNLLTVFEMKGGAAGTKTRRRLDSLGQHQEGRRDAVIRCLIHFLGESCEELIKDYQDISKGLIKDSFADLVMKIIVLASVTAEEGAAPDSVIIVIDGTETVLLLGFRGGLGVAEGSRWSGKTTMLAS
ncbi:hypothetical protein MHYP_G00092220 [Metynnis hypsauchen]